MIEFLRNLFGGGPKVDFKSLMDQGAMIVDVRTTGEFASGHIRGAVNVPLDSIRYKAAELKKKNKVIITCCRSGNRSSIAKGILTSAGITAYNGGAWDSLERKIL
jgi:rhodanese-related sulfurtransferase